MAAQSETILEVVAAKICRGDTFLLCQRAAAAKSNRVKHGSRPSAANAGKNWAFRSSFMNR